MQPGLKGIKRRQKFFSAFKGLCLRPVTPEGYFRDAENLSSEGYPAITVRKPRGVITECATVSAMYAHKKMCWLWEDQLFYGEEIVGELEPGEKMFASLGANIVIYPDKMLLNTENMTLTSLDNERYANTARVYACNRDGTAATGTSFTKIEAQGIGKGFREGDGVSISGLVSAIDDGNYLVQAAGDNFLIVVHALEKDAEITGGISVSRKAPDFDFICALDNRIWGASTQEHKICACKLGDPTNWNVFQGISTDAYQAVVPSPGPFTGCSSDIGSVIFFKEEEIIRVYGNKPSNFQVTSYRMPGVEEGSSGSVAYLESAVLYKGLAGIYVYDGGIPECISAFLGDGRYRDARAGAINGKYYISMWDQAQDEFELFVYDMRMGAWYRESAPAIRYFTRSGNEMYMCADDGNIYTVNGGRVWYDPSKVLSTRLSLAESRVDWYFETAPMSLCMPDRQYVSALHIRCAIKEGAHLKAEIRFAEEKNYSEIGTFSQASGERTITVPVPVRRSDSATLRFSGTGGVTITAIGKTFEEGSAK